MGRTASGVRGMRLRSNDEVIAMDIVNPKDTKLEFITIGENGVGKRTTLSEYKVQGRGGSGIKTADITAKTGNLIYVCAAPTRSLWRPTGSWARCSDPRRDTTSFSSSGSRMGKAPRP